MADNTHIDTELLDTRPIHGGRARQYRVELPVLGEATVTINTGQMTDDPAVIEQLAALVQT